MSFYGFSKYQVQLRLVDRTHAFRWTKNICDQILDEDSPIFWDRSLSLGNVAVNVCVRPPQKKKHAQILQLHHRTDLVLGICQRFIFFWNKNIYIPRQYVRSDHLRFRDLTESNMFFGKNSPFWCNF